MDKVAKVMHEYKAGKLHSGSKSGPVVHSRKQAVAIAMSEAGKSKSMRDHLIEMKRQGKLNNKKRAYK